MNKQAAISNGQQTPGEHSAPGARQVRCLSRRVWDWGKRWGSTLVHLVWFWRAGVLALVVVAAVFAWNEPDVQQRIAATGVVLVLGIVLALDLLVAFLNLPLLMFYSFLWSLLSMTSLLDAVLFTRHLAARQNRIAIWVLLVNAAVCAAAAGLWMLYQSLGNRGDLA